MKDDNNRILMVGPHFLSKGGISKVVKDYHYFGVLKRLNIDYLANYKKDKIINEIIFYLKSLLKILYRIKKYKIIHVHTASYWSFRKSSIILLLAKIYKLKLIIHIHGGEFIYYYDHSLLIEKKIINKLFEFCDRVVVLSDQWIKKIKIICKDKNKIRVIPNSIYKVNDVILSKNKYNNNRKNYNILFLGDIIKRKGVYDLLLALELILKKHKNIMLHLCGEGELTSINNIIHKNKIEKYVTIHGWIEGDFKKRLFEQAYVFVLPSYVENFPMSVVEAMSYGIPCICASVGCISDIIDDNRNGFLIDPGDVRQLSIHITNLINDEKKWDYISKRAKETILRSFTLEKTMYKIEKLFDELKNSN